LSGRRLVYLAGGTFAAAVCAALAIALRPIAFPLDDAYITLHNANVLLSGHDVNFGQPALVGATSVAHLLLVTGAALVLPPVLASALVGSAAVILYVLGLLRMAFCLGVSTRMAVLVVLLGCLTGYAPFQLFNGLETGLAMAAVTWALAFAAEPTLTWRLPLLCGVLPLIRPELALLSALLMLRQSIARLSQGELKGIATDLTVCLAAALPLIIWQWHNTGSILVNTANAKAAYFADAGQPFLRQCISFYIGLTTCGLIPMIVVFIFVFFRRMILIKTGVIFFVLYLSANFFIEPAAFHWNYGRYTYILLPVLLSALASAASRNRVAAFLLCLLLAPAVLQTFDSVPTYLGERRWTLKELADVSQWSRAHLPSNARIMIHDAGYFAFATNFRLVDVVGLKTPEAIPYHQRYTRPTGGASRDLAIVAIAQHWNPDYVMVLHDKLNFWGEIDADLIRHGWHLNLMRRPPGQYGYFVYHLSPPSPDQDTEPQPGH